MPKKNQNETDIESMTMKQLIQFVEVKKLIIKTSKMNKNQLLNSVKEALQKGNKISL